MATQVEKQEIRLEVTGTKQVEAALTKMVQTMDQKLTGLAAITQKIATGVQQTATQLQGMATRFGQSFGIVNSALGTLTHLFAGAALVHAAHAFHEVETSVAMLEGALRRAGVASEETINAFVQSGKDLALLTGVSGGSIREFQRMMLTMGATAEQVRTLSPLVLDLASAMGLDAFTAARQLANALDGTGLQIGRLNIHARDMDDLIGQLQENVGGAAAEAFKAQGAWGAMTQQMGRVKIAIGSIVSEPITAFLGGLAKGAEAAAASLKRFATEHKDSFERLTHGFEAMGNAIGGQMDKLLLLIGSLAAAGAVMKVLNGITNTFAGVTFLQAGAAFAKGTMEVQKYSAAFGMAEASTMSLSAKLSTLGAVAAAAFIGWQIGSVIKDMDLLGETIVNRIGKSLLFIQRAWVTFQMWVGGGTPELQAKWEELTQAAEELSAKREKAEAEADKESERRFEEKGKAQEEVHERERVNQRRVLEAKQIAEKGANDIDFERLRRGEAFANADLETKRLALDEWAEIRRAQMARDSELDVQAIRIAQAGAEDRVKAEQEAEQAIRLAHEKLTTALAQLDIELAKKREELRAAELRAEQDKNDELLRSERDRIKASSDRSENNWRLTKGQKRAASMRGMDEDIAALDRGIAAEEATGAKAQTSEEKRDSQRRVGGLRRERASVAERRGTMGDQADPNSIADQFQEKLVEMDDQMNTFAEGVADVLGSTIQGAVDGIASSIEGLIQGTMDWGDALRNIASTMVSAVVQAIAKMFAEWIIKMTLLRALESMFSTQRKAETASELPGNVANSAASAGSSWGMSSIIGLVAFLALIGVALAMGGAFAKGGRPPVNRVSLVGEQGPELFVPDNPGTILTNNLTERIVGGLVDPAMGGEGDAAGGRGRAGKRTTSTRAGSEPAGRKGSLNVVMVDDRNQARDYLRTVEGEAHIVDVVRRNALSVGLPG